MEDTEHSSPKPNNRLNRTAVLRSGRTFRSIKTGKYKDNTNICIPALRMNESPISNR